MPPMAYGPPQSSSAEGIDMEKTEASSVAHIDMEKPMGETKLTTPRLAQNGGQLAPIKASLGCTV